MMDDAYPGRKIMLRNIPNKIDQVSPKETHLYDWKLTRFRLC